MNNNNLIQKANKNKRNKSYGPVNNLEEYVKPDWWKYIFNSVYIKTDGDVVEDNNITKKEIDSFINILNLKKEDKILDLCCGQGRHSIELTKRGFYNIEGLDSSHYLIQRARNKSIKENLNIKFKEGNARKLPYENDTFDIVMILGNSFGYFETIHDDVRVLSEVFRVLKPRGKILIDVTDGEYLKNNFQSRSWEWIDKKNFVCRERSLSIDKQKLISREVVTHTEKGVLVDQFYSERLYTEKSMNDLLKLSGFSNIKIHGQIITESERNQDLGMMEKRLLFSSIALKEWTKRKKSIKTELKNVVVLLGDPDKQDEIKPSSYFDEDDFYTIDKLKEALNELKQYSFKYFSNHDFLINNLIKQKNKIDFVFNLCDEGFINDPKKELHIPSFLEMLNLHYTGSGPQCLAFCYDKSLIRGIAKEMEIPVPKAYFIKPEDNTFDINFNLPVIIKPNFGDSSFGITQRSVAKNAEEVVEAIIEIREKFGYDKPLLIEELLTGKDLSLGIIGNPPEDYKILPIIEEDYSNLPEGLPKVCGYEAKWLPDSPYWKNLRSIPADLNDEINEKIIACSLKLFERLECRDYCRFDWRLDYNGKPKLLEVNPNPGWCWDGHMAKMSKILGLSYSQMLEEILKAAEKRINGN